MIIKYFAALREALNCEEETIELPNNVTSVRELITLLQQKDALREKEFSAANTLLVAVNQTQANWETAICNKDEVAFFPPVTGG